MRKLGVVAAAAALAAPLAARSSSDATPATVAAIDACRKIADPAGRLACFDKAAADLDAAIASKSVYVVDKTEVKRTRRSLFGLPLPQMGTLLGGEDQNAVTQVELVARSVDQDMDGNWRIAMEDGSVWQQTDGVALGAPPHPGSKVLVKRAALGSFKMGIDGHGAVRAKRLR